MDGDTPRDRLQLPKPQIEDWHCLICVLTVSLQNDEYMQHHFKPIIFSVCENLDIMYMYMLLSLYPFLGDLEVFVWTKFQGPW